VKPAAANLPSTPRVITNTIGMQFAVIPAGEFLMGSPEMRSPGADLYAETNEMPQLKVKIAKPFSLDIYEVMVGQYRKVMNETPKLDWVNQEDDLPVICGSWKEAVAFCNELSEQEGIRPYYRFGKVSESSGDGYRLPTEAEWEYACRAGSTSRFPFGDNKSDADEFVWHAGNSGDKLHAVGQLKPNAFGLYDMNGNAWEFCADIWVERRPVMALSRTALICR
jgi:formylglycine-generating enzyme required for sulfatase activity